jgi:hypothetical protein
MSLLCERRKICDGHRPPLQRSAHPTSSPESFRGLTRRNFSRTSAGVAHTTCSNIPSPRPSGERDRERGFESRLLSPALSSVGDGGEGDKMVVTTGMRASAGTRFNVATCPDAVYRGVAADPAGTTRREGERLAFDDGRFGESNCLSSSLDSMPAFTLRLRYASADCFP